MGRLYTAKDDWFWKINRGLNPILKSSLKVKRLCLNLHFGITQKQRNWNSRTEKVGPMTACD